MGGRHVGRAEAELRVVKRHAKKRQPAYILRRFSSPPLDLGQRAEPRPNQPGRLTRAWVQLNTHGIALRSSRSIRPGRPLPG